MNDIQLNYKFLWHWYRLFDIKSSELDMCITDLWRRYTEPHRHYHTVEHIVSMLDEFDDYYDTIGGIFQFQLVKIAIFFHDSIYDNHITDRNELNSTFLANHWLSRFDFSNSDIGRVLDLIMATTHKEAANTHEKRLICDLDLASLGASVNKFNEQSYNIRKEFEWVPWEEYKRERIKILDWFVREGPIYNLPYFQEKYEELAQSNIKTEKIVLLNSK